MEEKDMANDGNEHNGTRAAAVAVAVASAGEVAVNDTAGVSPKNEESVAEAETGKENSEEKVEEGEEKVKTAAALQVDTDKCIDNDKNTNEKLNEPAEATAATATATATTTTATTEGKADDAAPSMDFVPGLADMFINSTDTLFRRQCDQRIPAMWNERPPLFHGTPTSDQFSNGPGGAGMSGANTGSSLRHNLRGFLAAAWGRVGNSGNENNLPQQSPGTAALNHQQQRQLRSSTSAISTVEEDPVLLKGMIRKGIPPPLRCAVWISNIIQASHPEKSLKSAHEYRTLAKVEVLDFAYQSLWQQEHEPDEVTKEKKGIDDSGDEVVEDGGIAFSPIRLNRSDAIAGQQAPTYFGNSTIWKRVEEEYEEILRQRKKQKEMNTIRDIDGSNNSGTTSQIPQWNLSPHSDNVNSFAGPNLDALKRVLYALAHVLMIDDDTVTTSGDGDDKNKNTTTTTSASYGGMAPLIPTLCALFLTSMSESYVFCAIREMTHASSSKWYFPIRGHSEHVAYQKAFLQVLEKLHPQTAFTLMHDQCNQDEYTAAIFQDFFTTILIEEHALRILDIYTLEGNKVLFRFGIALVVLYQKEWNHYYQAQCQGWWKGLLDFCGKQFIVSTFASSQPNNSYDNNTNGRNRKQYQQNQEPKRLNFEVLVKKAYGTHGRGIRRRYRFPRRPILSKMIELEEEAYWKEKIAYSNGYGISSSSNDNANSSKRHDDGTVSSNASTDLFGFKIQPLGLCDAKPLQSILSANSRTSTFHGYNSSNEENVVPELAKSSYVRTKLAEWLPISLRYNTSLDLIYSTNFHGRTLENFYRYVGQAKHTILLLEPLTSNKDHNDDDNDDDNDNDGTNWIIGMYSSHTWHPSTRVYGDGSCFLFRLVPPPSSSSSSSSSTTPSRLQTTDQSKCWKWKPMDDEMLLIKESGSSGSGGGHHDNHHDHGDDDFSHGGSGHGLSSFWGGGTASAPSSNSNNNLALLEQFQVSTHNFISMGGNADGSAGLRLNEDLCIGESSTAVGFDNLPLAGGIGGAGRSKSNNNDNSGNPETGKTKNTTFSVGLVEVYQLVRSIDGKPKY